MSKRSQRPARGADVEAPVAAPDRPPLPRFGFADDLEPTAFEPAAFEPPAFEPAAPAPAVAPTFAGPRQVYDFIDSLGAADAAPVVAQEAREPWLVFTLAGERYALPVPYVREIARIGSIARVPHAPRVVRGVTNLRGRVLPVVDLRVRLTLPEGQISPKHRVLVATARGRLLGLLVDGVEQILRVAPSTIQAPPPDVMTERSGYLRGVVDADGTLVILLDPERVLIVHDEPVPETAGQAAG